MIKLVYVILLVIVSVGFSDQLTTEQIPEMTQYPSHLNQECMDSVDPLNPSPLTWTDYNMLVVACLKQ